MVPLLSAHMQEIWFCMSHRESSWPKATEGASASAEQKLLERALKKKSTGNILPNAPQESRAYITQRKLWTAMAAPCHCPDSLSVCAQDCLQAIDQPPKMPPDPGNPHKGLAEAHRQGKVNACSDGYLAQQVEPPCTAAKPLIRCPLL